MSETIKERIQRWRLEQVQYLLQHIEGFVEDSQKEIFSRMRDFSPQTGLEKIESLSVGALSDPQMPVLVLERLSPFFESGLILQRGLDAEAGKWWVTDLFLKGQTFHLDLKDQVCANMIVPEITPLQINRAPAVSLLRFLKLEFMCRDLDEEAYLVRPTPSTAYVLISRLAAPWIEDHMANAQRLINKAFIY